MDESEFWNVISMLEWKFEGDDDRVLNNAITYLSKKNLTKIFINFMIYFQDCFMI